MRTHLLFTSFVCVSLAACAGANATELDDFVGAASVSSTEPAPPSSGNGAGAGAASPAPVAPGTGSLACPPGACIGADDNVACDDGLALTSTDAYDAAKALGLCKRASSQTPGWGVLSARWAMPDGTYITNADSWGLLAKLGTNVAPYGKAMLALSTGAARAPGDLGYRPPTGYDKGYTHAAVAGQPKGSSACPTGALGAPHDGVALELEVRVPLDAKSMSFTHQLFTSDYGSYVCSAYADVFVALMDPKPAGTDGNIVFDALGDPLSVNSASLLRACAPGSHNGLEFACPLGPASLAGTGYEDKAATGWLRTTVPVTGGADIKLRFAVWDSGDGILDSTVLLDELVFSSQATGAVATAPR